MPIKYYPEDNRIGEGTLGIKLPMNGSARGFFNMSRTTEEQAISNYINLLLTKKGERYMQPEFGIGIQFYLFEPNTEGLRLKLESEIRTQCAFWLPYIQNHSIDVRPRSDIPGMNASDAENSIQIVITFSVTELGANQQIIVFQNAGQVSAQVF